MPKERASHFLTIRLTESDYRLLAALADAEERTMAAVVRRLVRKAAREELEPTAEAVAAELNEEDESAS